MTNKTMGIIYNKERSRSTSIFYMVLSLLLAVSIAQPTGLSGQTTVLLSDPGTTYNNTDAVTTDIYGPVASADCGTIQYSLDYSFSLPWEGNGNMESADECGSFGDPCDGDPTMPAAGGCNTCWDFLWVIFLADGVQVYEELIGGAGTTDAQQSGTISFAYCASAMASTASIEVYTQTWASNESVTFSNITITCIEDVPVLPTIGPFCSTGAPVALAAAPDGVAGIWNGPGVSGGSFNPSSAGVGTWTLNFSPAAGTCASPASTTVTVNPAPTANPAGPLSQCGSGTATFNLAALNGTISGGLGSVAWFTNPATTIPVPNPSSYTTGSTTVYATVTIGACESAPVPVTLTLTPGPSIAPIADVTVCNSYTLPAITGSGLTGGQAYYTGANGTGTSFSPGEAITATTTLFAYDGSTGCEDEESFTITITPEPDITPIADATACNSYTLPAITGSNLTGGQAYYTGANGTGTSFNPGDAITATTTLFAYDGSSGCDDQESFTVTITPEPDIAPIADATACNSYTLPAITGSNLTGSQAYYTGANGTGTSFNPGEAITTTTTLFVYDGSPGCEDQESFTVTITPDPDITPIVDATACNSYILPAITGSNLTGGQAYYTGPNGTGTSFNPGDAVTATTTLFAYDGSPGCDAQESFTVTITPEPSLAPVAGVSECGSYILPGINGSNLTGGQAYYTGPNGTGTSFGPGDEITASTTLFIYDGEPGCDDQQSFSITITPEPAIDPLADASACNSYTLPVITGSNLTGAQAYYTGANGTGTSFGPGQPITTTTTLFIYDGIPGCEDQQSFTVTIAPEPTLFPMPDATACDSYTLPAINGNNLSGSQAYYTGPNGTGASFFPGDEVTASTTLFIYDGEPGCEDQTTFTVTVFQQPTVNPLPDAEACQSYVLPNITGSNLSGGQAYCTGPNGSGTAFLPGQPVFNDVLLYIYDSSAPGCSSEELFSVTVVQPPVLTPVPPVTSCGPYELPPIQGSNLSFDAAYYTGPNGTGQQFFPFDEIDTPGGTLLYIYDSTAPGCEAETQFGLLIEQAPEVDPFADVQSCGGYVLPPITGGNLSGGIAYFTAPNAGSAPIPPGEEVTDSGFYYAYAGTPACNDEEVFFVEILEAPELMCAEGSPASGAGSNDGSATVDIMGGVVPYELVWDGPSSGSLVTSNASEVINGLSPGLYSLSCTDANDCSTVCDLAITSVGCDLMLEFVVEDIDCAFDPTGSISVRPMGGDDNYTYLWNTSDTLEELRDLLPGTYSVTVTDGEGCQAEGSVELEAIFPTPTLEATLAQDTICSDECIAYELRLTGKWPFILNYRVLSGTDTLNFTQEIDGPDFGLVFCPSDSLTAFDDLIVEFWLLTDVYCKDTLDIRDTIHVNPLATETLRTELCPGESVTINGTVYDADNPEGVHIFPGGAVTGCDSILRVGVVLLEIDTMRLDDRLCPGESITVNGRTYSESNPTGLETFIGGAANGCDSVVEIDLNFFTPVINTIAQTLCLSDSLVVNGVVYNQANPSGTEVLPGGTVNGCDSTIIVDLSFDNFATGTLATTLCPGESITVNGNVYDESNPTGMETFFGGSASGCDSILTVNLSFFTTDTAFVAPALCPGEGLTVNGVIYDEANLSGTEVLTGATVNGCDSIVVVNLSYLSVSTSTLSETLCSGESLTVNGTLYDEGNPSGVETLVGGAASGCDSVVTVMLSFLPVSTSSLAQTLCPGESLIVNGTTYNEGNPAGTEVLTAAAANGCDSLINVMLSFSSPVTSELNESLCPGETITLNGTVYSQANPTGTEVFPAAAANGCDSTVNITLSFLPIDTNFVSQSLCPGESLTVNGTVYDEANPTGSETFPAAAANGCDSVVAIALTFLPVDTNFISNNLCPGESLIVNGTLYDEVNPTGTEVLPGAAANGCDSLIVVDLSFEGTVTVNVEETFCPGVQFVVNGTLYNQANPTGTELLPGAAANGCDSVIVIALTFLPIDTNFVVQTLCPGESLTVNGTLYTQANPTGTEVLANAAANGCDSVIVVALDYLPMADSLIAETLCPGESLTVNGTLYDQANPAGTDTLQNAAANGCDSVITVALSFASIDTNFIAQTLCTGDSLLVNGVVYNETSPVGTELLPGAAASGCDSVIVVDLRFDNFATGTFSTSLCPGESLTVNGETYDESNPTGTQTFLGGSAAGCDSILTVTLSFFAIDTAFFEPALCPGESLTVNGTLYDEGNPSGVEVLSGASAQGCDSIVLVNLNFLDVVENTIAEALCPGESVSVNGVRYDEANPTGTEILPAAAANGCDSVVTISLTFLAIDTNFVSQTLCTGESLTVNGTVYDEANPSGTEVLEGSSANGCDSLIVVDLSFDSFASGSFSAALCPGESVDINGTTYDEGNPTGTETLVGGAASGCDSVVTISLTFLAIDTNFVSQTLCTGESLTVNGTVYDEANPAGTEVLEGGSANGCDSLIVVDLSFDSFTTGSFSAALCPGESVEINGTAYGETNPTGTETLVGGSVSGCDSVVTISLTFLAIDTNFVSQTLCTGESLTVNGTVYDEANPAGTEVLEGGSANGCDSLIVVDLSFDSFASGSFSAALCPGESVAINGTTYDEGNPTGTETLVGGAASGCDSVVTISLTFLAIDTNFVSQTLCTGESLTVNGTVYDEANPAGTEVLEGSSANGCDSLIVVDLSFDSFASGSFSAVLCPGESVDINGTIYDEGNPTGTETLVGGSASGCDSVVTISLTFLAIDTNFVSQTLCTGENLTVNGTVYDEANPAGTEVLEGGSANGCDSLIVVDLSFDSFTTGSFSAALCPGESVDINGTIYDEGNPTGTETLVGGSVSGCDSVVIISLTFLAIDTNFVSQTLCTGESLTVNGTVYNEANPAGTEVLEGGSANGCDSLIVVDLSFDSFASGSFSAALCPGESVDINGTTYGEGNPTGTETLVGGSASGCDSVVTISLTFLAIDTNFVSQTLCTGESLTVNGTVYDEANPAGTEVLEGGSANGCDSLIVVNLSFTDEPTAVTIETNPTYCPADSVTLVFRITGASPVDLTLNDDNGVVATFTGITDGFAFQISQINFVTTYFVSSLTLTGSACPGDTGSPVTVRAEEISILDLAVTTDYNGFGVSCAGSADGGISFEATGGSPPYRYFFDNMATTGTDVDGLSPGTYMISVGDQSVCLTETEITITAPEPLALQAESLPVPCEGAPTGQLVLQNISGGVPPYLFATDGSALMSVGNLPFAVSGFAPGTYELLVQDFNECETALNLTVGEAPELFLDLGPDLTIKLGDSVRLNPQANFDISSFRWSPDSLSGLRPFVQPTETTVFRLTAEDENACSASASVTILVDKKRQVYAPNVFSPNGDGRNDIFRLYAGDDVLQIDEFRIFDRWGDQVYEAPNGLRPNDELTGWDGTYRGQPMGAAVFVFYAQVTFVDGSVELVKGEVMLLR